MAYRPSFEGMRPGLNYRTVLKPANSRRSVKSQNRHRAALAKSDRIILERHVFNSLRQEFDPLDREILERAFDVAWATVKETERLVAGFDNDDNLTAALRSNLIEIAQTKRFGDAEALLDVLLDRLTPAKL